MPRWLVLILLLGGAVTGVRADDSKVIEGIPPLAGPDPTLAALARAVRVATDATVSDAYLFGVSGAAFLATVCANNCNCRDYRELSLRTDPTLRRLGVKFVHIQDGGPEAWERMRRSIDDGVPVVAMNLFGDYEDALLVGYDEKQDLAYGWGVAAGERYATTKLSAWKSQPISGWVVERGRTAHDAPESIERDALALAVADAERPAIEGG